MSVLVEILSRVLDFIFGCRDEHEFEYTSTTS